MLYPNPSISLMLPVLGGFQEQSSGLHQKLCKMMSLWCPLSHACDFADVRRSGLQQRQNLKTIKTYLGERRKLKCVKNEPASPWSRFGRGGTWALLSISVGFFLFWSGHSRRFFSIKFAFTPLPPHKKRKEKKKEVQRWWSWKRGRVTSLMSPPMLVPLCFCHI